MNDLVAIVLAAGEGSRYGGPKALAVTDGRPWIALAIAMLREAGIEEIVAVVGAEAEAVRRLLPGEVRVAENRAWRSGRTGSVQCGLSTLAEPGPRAALLHQVDFPEVRAATVRALARACAARNRAEEAIVLPVHDGRRGHPIVLGRTVWPEVCTLGPDEPLRAVVRRDPARVVEVAVDDPGIHRNRNVPPEEER